MAIDERDALRRVIHPGGEPAVSIHVYSPELRRMGAYARGERGEMQRHPVDSGAELKSIVSLRQATERRCISIRDLGTMAHL
jgi:hypothetical protein